jgi:Transposase IS4
MKTAPANRAVLSFQYRVASSRPPAAAIQSTIVVHGTQWIRGNDELPVNDPVQYRPWALRTPPGEMLSAAGGISERSALDLFLHMFPPWQLQEMRRLTNRELQGKGKTPTTPGEILKYLGLLLLMTRFEFGVRATLRSTNQEQKLIPPPAFGKTGMSKGRFDHLHSCVRYSHQPAERTATISSEWYRWRLIDELVRRFNEHRLQTFSPSDVACVDESMSKWCGAGGLWINEG